MQHGGNCAEDHGAADEAVPAVVSGWAQRNYCKP